MSDVLLAVLLAAAGTLVSIGAAQFHPGAGLMVGGILLAVWSLLVLAELPDREVPE